MRWRSKAGQATLEAALIVPLVILLFLALIAVGYAGIAELLVVTGAGQGARQGAALCAQGRSAAEVIDAAQQTALDVLTPLAGPKSAEAHFDDQDVVVTSSYTYVPPLPGARLLVGGQILMQETSRYRCE